MRAAGALFLLVATGFFFTAPPAQAQDYGFVTMWGSQGSGDGQFGSAQGVATDVAGNVYVIDWLNARVQKFKSNGRFLTKWGSKGTGDGQFDGAFGIATDPAGNVYVADTSNDRIQKFTSNGAFITKWGRSAGRDSFGGARSVGEVRSGDDGQLESPLGVATDPAGNVYVADSGNHRVQKFTANGAFITNWGSEGGFNGQFRLIREIDADAAGNVYVYDQQDSGGHPRIQKFTSNGAFITKWDIPQSHGIATDAAGNVYASDFINDAIRKFTASGAFRAKWGGSGDGKGQFVYPTGVAIDVAGNVYVADEGNNRIQKFAPLPPRPALKKGPKGKTKKRKAVFFFRFRSPTPGARFQCRLTGQRVPKKQKRWRRCRSPKRYKGLRPGRKVFWVRATLRGQVGKPDKRRWRVLR